MGLVVIVSTAELWSEDSVKRKRKVSGEESAQIGDIVGDRWQAL